MQHFPYIANYVNELFDSEKARFDYIFLRIIHLLGPRPQGGKTPAEKVCSVIVNL